ncbi:IreB family regulatory phosphoprotein [Weissella tructae]|jgi:uncharacterized protein (UPF0297 family)|uniref:Uncharacterized protein n=2 Tax=Weissella TaxID=46255 RepID=A0A075TZN5_9LACO|nr:MULTISPECIES: IreB family regulatory phosphoprotein [Weissella]AIG65343.1 hypothetical protein WS08_0404 [Weissella tructae]AIM62657.1 hypothetical protein WS74_0405 [Weissella ceti]AIM63992.1 hypothetical protein WS105_0402 [Weissella ceti]ELA07197.1 hypothetical protein WCNC_06437 [Weissella ceti NC36]QVV91724.1 IreB family regulatory phosphoprotein [Weissella tructae]
MNSLDHTTLFNVNRNEDNDVRKMLETVYEALEEKGYDPTSQIVGYLISNDPAYIPRVNDARNLIRKFERDEVIGALVKNYLGK